MRLKRIVSIDDFRESARRTLPKIIFDFIEGGVDAELCLETNAAIRRSHRLVPRYLADIEPVDPSAVLMGQRYGLPFGIAPIGLAGLFRPGAEIMLARAAEEADIPFVLSTVSTVSLEQVAEAAPRHVWFQLYGARDRAITADMIRRVNAAGIRTLMVTVDTPVSAKRERNIRNGFSRPLRMRLPILLEALCHPGWIWRYLASGGTPAFGNWTPYAEPGASKDAIAAFSTTQTPNRQTWADLQSIRAAWPHKLVVKGLMHPDDAVRAVDIGADGIVVSNHGGRVLDRAPSSFEIFPYVRDAVGGRAALMLDSGLTRGSDIVTAFCLGAQFVFVGRAALYGAVVGGVDGARRAIAILRDEVVQQLGQIGCASPAGLGPDYLLANLLERGGSGR